MPFVKLDCGILRSTIWDDHEARIVFLTALLMAEPREFREPVRQINARNLEYSGWSAPPGWYGFVAAAGSGIIRSAGGIEIDAGYAALERLGSPEQESRSQDFDGRRLIRIDGGYLVLNYDKYRERDYTAAERQRRYRERHGVTRDRDAVTRNITQAEEEARSKKQEPKDSSKTRPSFDEDSREMKAARYLFTKIRTNNETAKEPNFQEWAREFDAIFRIDHRDPARVLSVINFAQADEFWYKNILSPKSLRKNFDKLTVKMTAKPAATRAAEPVPRKDL